LTRPTPRRFTGLSGRSGLGPSPNRDCRAIGGWLLFAHNGHRSSSDNGGFPDDLPRSRDLFCV
jgi:hypothetical protein